MAPGGPTRALLQKIRMIDVSNENVSGYFLLLEMALQAKRRITLGKQSLIHRAMRRMAVETVLPHRRVLEQEWTALLGMTAVTDLVDAIRL